MDNIIERIVNVIIKEQQLRSNQVKSAPYVMSNKEVVHMMEFEPYEIEKIIRGVLLDEISQIENMDAQKSINAEILNQLQSIASDVHSLKEHGIKVYSGSGII